MNLEQVVLLSYPTLVITSNDQRAEADKMLGIGICLELRKMTQKAKLRWLSAIQVVMALLLFPTFFCWAVWESAETREEALYRYPGTEIPVDWRAMWMNHGTAREWPLGTVSQNPVGFTLCTLLFVSILGMLFWTSWIACRLKGVRFFTK